MKNRTESRLFPSLDQFKDNIPVPESVHTATNSLDLSRLGKTEQEQQEAKKIIDNWAKTLWDSMVFLSKNNDSSTLEKIRFHDEFETKLVDFITNKDHGIEHSFFVYKWMLHLAQKDGNPIDPNSEDDKKAQLLALLHDVMQSLPFALSDAQNPFAQRYSKPKNEHAKIIADLTKIFGMSLGFDRQTVKQLSYGLEVHDSSYAGTTAEHENKLDYLSKLLHDADRFGASLETDIPTLTAGMLKRNYEANRGAKGSYLVRDDVLEETRDRILYGDRCLIDSVSLVRKEFELKMFTEAGKELAKQRRAARDEQIISVYTEFYDMTNDYISDVILPNLGTENSQIILTIDGMDQVEKPLEQPIQNAEMLQSLINKLYETPIALKLNEADRARFQERYDVDSDARGLKIHVQNIPDAQIKTDVYIDPSIARFCFMENGREQFQNLIKLAFTRTSEETSPTNQ